MPPGCRRTHNLAVLHLCWLRWSLQLLLEESTSSKQDRGKREGSWTPTPQKRGCLVPSPLAPKILSQNCLALPRKKIHNCVRADGGVKVTSDNMLRLLMLRFILKLNICVSLRFADGVPSLDILLSSKGYTWFQFIIPQSDHS